MSRDGLEIPLTGGNVAPVVRKDDTVRRVVGPWTPAVHALLHYLDNAGFDAAPRALGYDECGREILSYVHGQVHPYPMPNYVWSEQTLISVARLLRRYHDLVEDFQPPLDAVWRLQPGGPSDGPIICHNDGAPYNTVFVEGEPVALIDWDFASPGTREWDLAYALWYWVPLYDGSGEEKFDHPRRLRLFVDAYGLEDRSSLLPTIRQRQQVAYNVLREWGGAGISGFAEMWAAGHGAAKLDDMRWLERHWNVLQDALETNSSSKRR